MCSFFLCYFLLFFLSPSTSPVSFALLLPFLSKRLLRSWTSSGPWMAHCYARSSVASVSRCHEQPQHRSLHKVGSSHSTRGRKLHPANTQTLRAQLSFRQFRAPLKEHSMSWFCLSEDRGFSGSGGSGPAAHDRGPDEEITHGQLGFELLTPAFLGSTAWWPWGSTSSKRPSSSELADLFWLGPRGTITPWRLEVILFRGGSGEGKFRNNIWIVCMWIALCKGMGNATNTFLIWGKRSVQFKTLRLKKDLPTVGAFIWTKLQTKSRS